MSFDTAWRNGATPGMRALAFEAGTWAVSPDDQWIAVADLLTDAADQCHVRCIEVNTGRVVLDVRGREVKALAWLGAELLLVVRAQGYDHARAVLHAVPDGAAIGSLALESIPNRRVRITTSLDGSRALVAPARWVGELRERASRRVSYVVRADPFEVLCGYEPDASTALPRLPDVRAAVVALSPDGDRIAVWVDAPAVEAARGEGTGALLLHDIARGRDEYVRHIGCAVDSLTWVDAHTVALRSVHGVEAADRGDLEVLSLRDGSVRFSSVGEDPPHGGVGAWATFDVHPDRQRIVLAGRLEAPSRSREPWVGALREIDLAGGTTTSPVLHTTRVHTAWGAVWAPPFFEGPAVLRARSAKIAEVLHCSRGGGAPMRSMGEVLLDGRKPRRATLLRSPTGQRLVLTWQVEPEGCKRMRYGAVTATRLAWVDWAANTA